jgi:mannose/fructose/N-acetylgalactosamine-specific phosphotransferase system component IIB
VIVLTRVDDRLIHGQVVIAWAQTVSPNVYVLADDDIAAETEEHDIFRAGVPAGQSVQFMSVQEAAALIPEFQKSPDRILILVADIDSVVRLCDNAPSVTSVNLGGVHGAQGRRQRLPYLFLSDREESNLKALDQKGVKVTIQDVPGTPPLSLGDLK